MRQGYRGNQTNYLINSQVEQFNFSPKHLHLQIKLKWNLSEKLAPIERVNFYLTDHRLLKNIFIVDGSFAYYYEEEWYYPIGDPREDVPVPVRNIEERFNFQTDDIAYVVSDNNPQKAKFDITYMLSPIKLDPLDSQKSIKKNVLIVESEWDTPPKNQEILYSKKG
jgi:hypothetical protein